MLKDTSLADKRDVVVKFFKERQGLDASKVDGTEDMFTLKLMQWGNVDRTYKAKPTLDLSPSLKYTKADIENVDAVLFMCETYAWREVYAIKCEELQKHLDADGNGDINVANIPCANYFFFDMYKAIQWLH